MTHWFRTIWSRLWALLRKERLDREFDEELTTHLELLIDEGRRSGMSEADARPEALRKLGQWESLRESHREQRGIPVVEVLAQDLRYAVRNLWKNPAFTCIATLSLALGIGANSALFSLVDGMLLRSLPVREPDRLVQVQLLLTGKNPITSFSKPAFDHLRMHDEIFSEVVGFERLDRPAVNIDGIEEPSRNVEQVSENFFRGLGVAPTVGQTPRPSDGAVAVISYRFWRERFDSSSSVLGRVLAIDGQPYSIIGVAPPRFFGLSIESSADLWISSRTSTDQQVIARLKPGVTSAQAQAATQVFLQQLAQTQPAELPRGIEMRIELLSAGKGLSQLRRQYERPLLALTVLATLVLLITCTNVGNLLMVRNVARRREMTVRFALGARRSRLILQYLVESGVLAALGGIIALVIARWGVSIILSMLPLQAIPEGLAFHADIRMLSFAVGVSLLSALLFGLVPAWRATRVDLTPDLRLGHGSSPTKGARRWRHWLVACQVGLSVLLLVGAGLFVQTLRNLAHLDVGFNPNNLLQVSVDTRASGYVRGQVGGLYRLLFERLSAIPGVRSVTFVRNPVMQDSVSRGSVALAGRTLNPGETWDVHVVGPSFFETMNIPVVRGSTFTPAHLAQDRGFVVISEAFARRYFPNEDPVGKRVGEPPNIEVIGVVGDARLGAVRTDSSPTMYIMARSEPDRFNALQVRTSGDEDAIARAVREEVRRVNPRLLIDVRTMRRQIDESIVKERLVAAISGFFSLLGLLLASIGIFGVASYTVAQRTNELGIRIALGAGRWSVIRDALRDTMLVFCVGLATGTIVGVAAVRLAASLMSDLLFGLTATDAANIVGAVVLMVVVALAACILPAVRATRVDPVVALRYE